MVIEDWAVWWVDEVQDGIHPLKIRVIIKTYEFDFISLKDVNV